MFYRKFEVVLCPFKKVQNKEKSEKCEINCRPSVLRSPTVGWRKKISFIDWDIS